MKAALKRLFRAVKRFRSMVLDATSQKSLQKRSELFWESSKDTHLADAEYYRRREAVVTDWLSALPVAERALDLGCGDGSFTKIVARRARKVVAVDIGKSLIRTAENSIKDDGVHNIEFVVSRIELYQPDTSFDRIFALGVTSCFIEDLKFNRILDMMAGNLAKDGYLMMIDTIGVKNTHIGKWSNGYVCKYRKEDFYLKCITSRGFRLLKSVVIRDWVSTHSNRAYLFSLA